MDSIFCCSLINEYFVDMKPLCIYFIYDLVCLCMWLCVWNVYTCILHFNFKDYVMQVSLNSYFARFFSLL